MSRKSFKSEPSFLENNPEYYIQYYEFIKNESIWNNSGQYWLGKEYGNRAKALLNGNPDIAMAPIKSETYYYNKDTMNIGNQ